MRLPSRFFYHFRSTLFFAFILIFATLPAISQQRGVRKPGSKQTTAQKSKDAERARRAEAVSLLVETADKARLFDDLFYRARIQATVADTLWLYDERQARAIFKRAWEAAKASDLADREEAARESGALPNSVAVVTDARDEVLGKAARRDAQLADAFLRNLMEEKNQAGNNSNRNQTTQRTVWRELSASGARRMALAFEMLSLGESGRAYEVAAPLINEGVSADLIAFILRLREQNDTGAQALYLRLVESAATDPRTDANAILLLSSPIISPGLMVAVDEFGSLQVRALQHASAATEKPLAPRALTAFYNLAASVLLRPSPPSDEAVTMQDLVSRFYATGRLLPFFENATAPYAAFAPALRARHSELFNSMEAARREQISAQFELSGMSRTGNIDPLRSQTEQLSRSEDVSERRRLAFSIVKTAVRNRSWDRARRAAAEIENMDERQSALSFIMVHQIKDVSHAYADEKEDDFEEVVRFVRGADVPPFAKAWGLAQAAAIAMRKREPGISQTVAQLIDEAEGHASRVAERSIERVAAYGVLTITAARISRERAWTLIRELVKVANSVENYKGDEDSLEMKANADSIADEISSFSVEAEVFRLDGIFATMARLDYDKALTEARALESDVARAFATIAIARVMLEKRA